MRKLNSNSGKQIIGGLVVLIIITFGMGIYTIHEMSGLSTITANMHYHTLTMGNAVRDVRADIITMHRFMKDVTIATNPEQLTKAMLEVDRLETLVFANFDIIEERFLGNIEDVQKARHAFANWKSIRDEVIGLCGQNKFKEAALITTGKGAEHVEKMDVEIQLMIDFANQKGHIFFAEWKTESKQILTTTFALLLGALFTGITIAIFIVKIWRETEQFNTKDNWQKKGINELNIAMRGNKQQQALSSHIVTFLAEYLTCHIGAFYIVNAETKDLHFAGGYGLSTTPPHIISKGEGLTGEVLRSGKKILTTTIPKEYFDIHSATGSSTTQQLFIIPFLRENKVIGIIELGKLAPFTQTEIAFLEQSMPAIATTIIASTSRLQLSTLLAESRLRTKQLEQQEEKLTRANNRLGEKSKELSQQHDEIERRNLDLLTARSELELRADELARSSKYKSEFLANMSHELRTPLNSLLILSDSLCQNKRGHLDKNEVRSASVINHAGQDLLTLINEILDLAKIEAGHTEVTVEPFAVTTLVDHLHSIFKPLATEKGLEFKISVHTNTPQVIHSDPFRLNQILKNLIGNSLKFTSAGFVRVNLSPLTSEIQIGTRTFSRKNTLIIQISDSGIGIANEQHQSIFEPFQQEDGGTARQYGGTGLGLSISRELAHLLGGEIGLTSEKDTGATFTLYLPITRTDTEIPKKNPPKQPPLAIPPTQRKTTPYTAPNILIIEDDPKQGQLIINQCQEYGLHSTLAKNTTTGLTLAKQRPPQGIIIGSNIVSESKVLIQNKLKDLNTGEPIPIYTCKKDDQNNIKTNVTHFLTAHQLITEPVHFNLQDIRVLLVDDDMRHVFALSAQLEQEEIIVEIAENGQRALEKLATEPAFDLILMDIMMPEMNGYETIEKIRSQDKFRNLPIIVITAKAMMEDRQHCFKTGASEFFAKPINIPELLKKIAYLVETTETKA